MRRFSIALVAALSLTTAAREARAQALYAENFNDGLAATRWTVSGTGGNSTTDFAFAYTTSTFSIPAAPRGGGLGLRMDPNVGPTGAISAVMAFPNGESFSLPVTMSFDLWMQYTPATAGTTEFAIFGLGHTSTAIQSPTTGTGGPPTTAAIGPSPNGVDYTIVGDNGANRDVRVYVNGVELPGTAGGYVGSGTSAPLIQETGTTPYSNAYTGATPGNQWLKIDVTALSDRTIYTVNDVLWAQTITTATSPGNIMLGTMDLFSGVSANPTFVVYDNVLVTVPEPSAVVTGIAGVVGIGVLGLRRRSGRSSRSRRAT